MSDEDLPTPAIPKPKRKYQRRRTNRLKPGHVSANPPVLRSKVVSAEFPGMSPNECAEGCYEAGHCVISGDVCVHPFKGGLQSAHQSRPDVVRKFMRAKKLLAHQKIEARSQ